MTSYNFRSRSKINWKELCYGESLPRIKKERTETTSNRAILQGSYEIERLITKKYDKREGEVFLVKWLGYTDTETTWEPESHIDTVSLSKYIPNSIETARLVSATQSFEEGIYNRLGRENRNCLLRIRFDLDIFRYCFRDDKEVLLYSPEDFCRLPLSKNWFYRIDKNAVGQRVRFPIRLTPKLGFRKTYFQVNGETVEKSKPLEFLHVCVPTCNF